MTKKRVGAEAIRQKFEAVAGELAEALVFLETYHRWRVSELNVYEVY